MELNEIIEGNGLIAEFMGCKIDKKSYDEWWYDIKGGNYGYTSQLEYHSSWDWLMPVVEKIESAHDMYFRIDRDWVFVCSFNDYSGIIIKTDNFTHEGGKLKGVWLAIIEFIKWYNNAKK